ncbi:MAG: porin family protein [Bacteroides sp.]|nr:porin family protein [Bacteroides sp.]
MKKIFSVLMVAVALMMAAPAQAQLIKFGVKGGLNMSKIDWGKENSTGFFIGPMAEITLPIIGLGIDGALMYSQKTNLSYEYAGNDVSSVDLKEQGIEIPINLKYSFGLGSLLGVYLAAGPDFFYNFKDIDATAFKAKKSQVAINLGAGVKLLKKLQVGITYQIPMGDSFEWEDAVAKVANGTKTKTWQVSAAYIF